MLAFWTGRLIFLSGHAKEALPISPRERTRLRRPRREALRARGRGADQHVDLRVEHDDGPDGSLTAALATHAQAGETALETVA